MGNDQTVGAEGTNMKIGDIHWIQLPTTSGREQMGNRPAIIVQSLSLSETKERNL